MMAIDIRTWYSNTTLGTSLGTSLELGRSYYRVNSLTYHIAWKSLENMLLKIINACSLMAIVERWWQLAWLHPAQHAQCFDNQFHNGCCLCIFYQSFTVNSIRLRDVGPKLNDICTHANTNLE